ncbi:MAG: Exodeoxyribonuclease 7 large subunit [Alphaproteobacteria bacterium MarineAlpha3_Bin5]|nr:MAG: Exodeoxyribonuclease 7 large subunit [Alphaproteobacteria bacterium MarineAlpha3_Bin5]
MAENPTSKFNKETTEPVFDHNLREYSVSELSSALKIIVEKTFTRVKIRGEVFGFKEAASGHLYFSLKDENATLDSVCWRGTAARLGIAPEDGMEVVVTGRITTFSGRSKYQIIVESLELAGEGALLKLLEDRKRKLANEGLFDEGKKHKIPFIPESIGIVTSPTGAVIKDILHRLSERFPRRTLLWPVKVQGEGSAAEIAAAIHGLNTLAVNKPDLIIVARGGGSLEDLWTFNEESVVRAAANSRIPIISAVGHETDWTLIDLVADVRAPTPTAAAELAVPVRVEVLSKLKIHSERIDNAINKKLQLLAQNISGLARILPEPRREVEEAVQRVDTLSERLDMNLKQEIARKFEKLKIIIPRPGQLIDRNRERLNYENQNMAKAITAIVRNCHKTLKHLNDLMESYSYERILERGFAVISDDENRTISSARKIRAQQNVNIAFHDGTISAIATKLPPLPKKKKPKKKDGGSQGSLL